MNRLAVILLMVFLLTSALMSQSVRFVLNDSETTDTLLVSPTQIDSIVEQRLGQFSAEGYWDARLEMLPEAHHPGMIEARVFPGDASTLGFIHFQGLRERDALYLEKEFKMGRPSISSRNLSQAKQRITGLGYQLADGYQLSQDVNGEYHMKYRVKHHPELMAQGLASFNQSSGSDSISWYGQINIHIPNFDGRGKIFDFSWERLRSNSESFNLGFQYPWLLQLPITGHFQFGREVIDGNYQILKTNLGFEWDLDWERSIYFSFEKHESIITHEGSVLFPEWEAKEKRLLGLGYRQTSLNPQIHQGISLKTMLFQEMNFEPASTRILTLRSEAQTRLSGHFFMSQRTRANIQNLTDSQTDPSIMVPLGGVNSVRGYEEAYLRVPNTMSMQTTLHYTIGSQSQILTFYDIGLYNTNKRIKTLKGYGLGVQLRSERGPIRLILATHEGLNLRNSFLHIEYSGGISWIDR
ncbi:MAG: BamA/TamA family outer membrane protein [Candidatus Marinimicrobia bacterium]|nr:BamA/TamA family outer membrane protein [Candidatus Neomarinimicrobiota bacterium]